MKRISFKDSGGLNLTQAVLSGRKTMTRRAVPYRVETDAMKYAEGKSNYTRVKFEYVRQHSPYKIGDIVAIQQAYKEVYKELLGDAIVQNISKGTAGFTNKMFVAASMMPHHIRITDVRVERLQDISDEDCLREGIVNEGMYTLGGKYIERGYHTPREAFAALIDKVSGRGTWDSNPLVFVYSFERVD